MDKHQTLYDLKREIYFLSNKNDEEKYLDAVQNLVEFIYENFQEEDTLNPNYYSQKFEIELAKSFPVLLCIFDVPFDNKVLKKSQNFKDFIISIALDLKYKNARADLLKQIANIWIKDFIKLALNEELWYSDLMNIEMISALNKKRIGGFSQKSQKYFGKRRKSKIRTFTNCNKILKK